MIKGTISPALTFFDDQGQVNEAMCTWHMNWMLDKGIDGLFVTGTYGSGYLMTLEQRSQVFLLARDVVNRRNQGFVIAHVGCPDTDSSVFLTKEAARLGLQGVSAVSPYNYPYTQEELLEYYRAILREKGPLKVYAYNNPKLTGITLDFSFMKKLIPLGLSGIKDSSLSRALAKEIQVYNETQAASFQYIAGSTTNWLTFSRMGFDTMIAGVCNYAPELVSRLYALSFSDIELASILSHEITEMSNSVKQGNSLLSCHLALKARGFEAGCMKAPLTVDYQKNSQVIMKIGQEISHALAWI